MTNEKSNLFILKLLSTIMIIVPVLLMGYDAEFQHGITTKGYIIIIVENICLILKAILHWVGYENGHDNFKSVIKYDVYILTVVCFISNISCVAATNDCANASLVWGFAKISYVALIVAWALYFVCDAKYKISEKWGVALFAATVVPLALGIIVSIFEGFISCFSTAIVTGLSFLIIQLKQKSINL